MPTLPFIPGYVYNRRADIHGVYGGNWQGGICPSSSHPYIFIFTGKSGSQHGYQDRWENENVFSYTGEGQQGDMAFTRGNLALHDHLNKGKRVFLFEFVRKGFVRFICEVEFFDADYFEAKDKEGNLRKAIKFFFLRKGAHLTIETSWLHQPTLFQEQEAYYETYKKPNITERSGLITSRVGQGAYRKSIIHRWDYKCAVTGFAKLDVLIASHILPWTKSNDEERLDVNNGILLSPTYDALFDRHLISFENDGKIILSEKITPFAYQQIGVTGKETIKNLRSENCSYLDQHRNQIFQSGYL